MLCTDCKYEDLICENPTPVKYENFIFEGEWIIGCNRKRWYGIRKNLR